MEWKLEVAGSSEILYAGEYEYAFLYQKEISERINYGEFSIQYIYEACKQSNYPLLRHKSVSALSTAVYKPYTAPAQRQTLL